MIGVIYCSYLSACNNNLNWDPRISKIRKMLQLCYKRKQSILGRINSIKIHCLSQLVYIMRSISIPEHVLLSINKLFFEFLWKGKPNSKKSVDRIKRNISKLKNQIKKKCGNCKVKMPDLRLTEGESIELDYPKVKNFEDIKGLRHDDSYTHYNT